MTIINWVSLMVAIVLIGTLVAVHFVLRATVRDAEGFMGVLKKSGGPREGGEQKAPDVVPLQGESRNMVAILGERKD